MSEILKENLGMVVDRRAGEHAPRNGVWLVDIGNAEAVASMLEQMLAGDKDQVNSLHELKTDASADGFTLILMKEAKPISVLSTTLYFSDREAQYEIDLIYTDAGRRREGHASTLIENFCEIYQEAIENTVTAEPEVLDILECTALGSFNEMSYGLKSVFEERIQEIVASLIEREEDFEYA